MMKFSALNESSLSDDDGDPELATREAQEEEAYSLYHLALKKRAEGGVAEAEVMLKDILDMEFLTQVRPNEEDSEDEEEDAKKKEAPLRPALTLKYLLYKNLAGIANERKDHRAAVAFFLDALEIDNTDVMMWYQMGKASINIANYSLARLCFEEGLKCNPNHWPCLDNVITVMYTLNDYANCLYYIAKALERECYYLKGLAFKDEIYREDPSLKSFCEGYFNKCDSSIHQAEYDKEEAKQLIQESLDMRIKKQSFYKPTPLPVLTLSQPISEKTWKNVGESLVNMYECIKMANPSVSYSCKVDLSPFLDTSPVSVESDKLSLSSLSCSSNSAAVTLKPQGLLQLAPVASCNGLAEQSSVIEPVEMEVDPGPLNLVLTPVEVVPSDTSMGNDSTSSNRRQATKRKRLLSELADTKRRSSRVRNPAIKKPQDNINYQDLLQKFLPPRLMGSGKCDNDPDDDSEPVSLDKGSLSGGPSSENDRSDKTTPDSGDLAFSEREDVTLFISTNQNNSGIIDLLYKYCIILGRKGSCLWPKNLIDVYCEAFARLRKHITTPNIFCQSSDPERIKEVSLAILCYCEFKVDKWYLSTGHSMSFSPKSTSGGPSLQLPPPSRIGDDFHSDMEFVVMLTARTDLLDQDWLDFSARAFWVKAKFHSLEGEIDLAVCCMGRLNDLLVEENDPKITLQNCGFSNVISSEKVQQQLESLQRCQSLEEVQRLYESNDYSAVVRLLVRTFDQPHTKRKQPLEGVPERHAQLLLLQNSLWKLERYKECVYWSEVSFNEALQQFMNAARSDWSETMAQLLNGLNNCVKLDPAGHLGALDDRGTQRLTRNLILAVVIQMENYDFSADNASLLIVLPWMLLYTLIRNEENKGQPAKQKSSAVEPSSNSNQQGAVASFLSDFDLHSSMPSSLMLLLTAHEYLGRRSWCTFAEGQLLLHNMQVLLGELKGSGGGGAYKEDLETGLEQCIYCLYGHPNKRSRAKHLQEHNSKQLTLTWERAAVVFQYFRPSVLPEFDSYRTSTVSAELESLLKRIISLVPPDLDPSTKVDSYTAYIESATDKCPEPPFKDRQLSSMIKDLYYLLGDYYFKNKEFSKAIRFYLQDICFNPDRQDSWAGMALSRSSQLDQKLNSYELRNESTIYRKSSAALKCFEHALQLDPSTTPLWIEHGSLAYILHSHASRQLKQVSVCDDLQDLLRRKRTEMLQVAEKCFRSANRCEEGAEPEEAWLHHYMLGKIGEKKGEGPSMYLRHYQKALNYLHEDFARYPQKIQYHNPSELSIEVLEVYYRVHASCLKYLQRHETRGMDLATLRWIKRCLAQVADSPFALYQEKCKREGSGSTTHSDVEEAPKNTEVPSSQQQPTAADHTYFDLDPGGNQDRSKGRSRPSVDSSPDSRDSGAVKEVVDSLVGVITERFVDSESESSGSKIVVESVGEQSVYTTKIPETTEERAVKSITMECSTKVPSPSPPETALDEASSSVPDRAMELESEAAASLLVAEMKLHDTDYCNSDFDMASQDLVIDESVGRDSPGVVVDQKSEEDANDGSSVIVESVGSAGGVTDPKLREDGKDGSSGSCLLQQNDIMPEATAMEVDEVRTVIAPKSEESPKIQVEPKQNSETGPKEQYEIVQVSVKKSPSDSSGPNAHSQDGGRAVEVISSTVVEMKTVDVQKEVKDVVNVEEKVKVEDQSASVVKKSSEHASKDKVAPKAPKPPSSRKKGAPSREELRASLPEIAALIPACLDAMRECLARFVQHYKALYRMAHYYCYSPHNRNLQYAREILLAATPATRKYAAMPGLFADRKNTNFFNGIWRAPSNEIDRPGSFGAHMHRSVVLLIAVLTQQRDYNMLLFLTQQLYRTPDLGKKYMRDTDRVLLVRSAYGACVDVLRGRMDSLLQEEPPPEEGRLTCCLLEIYRACQQLLKAGVYTTETNQLLEEAYTMYRLGEVDDHPSVLEQATKFCQIQLVKSYPQSHYELGKAGPPSKWFVDPDAPPPPSPDASSWQKEFAKSLGRKPRPDLPPEQQPPVILIPIDSSQFAAAAQMVHVEEPKPETLQSCSVAYLPVFPKELVSSPFDCFVNSLMRGYQVSTPDAASPVNLSKKQPNFPFFVPPASKPVGRPRKRRRRASRMLPAPLDLCKRALSPAVVAPICTRPIVSSSIANSIAELQVGTIRSTPKKSPTHVASSVIRRVPSAREASSFGPLALSCSPPTEVIASSSAPSSGTHFENPSLQVKGLESEKAVLPSGVKAEDAKSSSHIDSLLIEQCAREMLEFLNQTVEDVVLLHPTPPSDFSDLRMRFLSKSGKNGRPPKDTLLILKKEKTETILCPKMEVDKIPVIKSNTETAGGPNILLTFGKGKKREISKTEIEKTTKVSAMHCPKTAAGKSIIEIAEDLLKGQNTSSISVKAKNDQFFEKENKITVKISSRESLKPESNIEAAIEDLEYIRSKLLTKDIEENSDTLDAEIKEDSLSLLRPQTFQNQLDILKDGSPEMLPLESCELSKDSSTEFAISSSPQPPDLEEEKNALH